MCFRLLHMVVEPARVDVGFFCTTTALALQNLGILPSDDGLADRAARMANQKM